MRQLAIGSSRAAVLLAAVLLAAGIGRAEEAVEPLHFSKLIPLLPDKVEGFVAEKAEGSTSSAMGFKLTVVSRTYHKAKEDAEETVTVKITDGAGNQFFAAAHAAAIEFSNESTDGYQKGFKLDGYPAIEKYSNDGKSGELTVFVSARYLVEITVNGIESAALQAWWKKIDAKKLTEMKAG